MTRLLSGLAAEDDMGGALCYHDGEELQRMRVKFDTGNSLA